MGGPTVAEVRGAPAAGLDTTRGPFRTFSRVLALALVTMLVLTAAPAQAAEGSIAHAETTDGQLRVLVDVPADADIDLTGVTATLDGTTLDTQATPAGAGTLVARTAVLVMDTSNSMRRRGRFEAAQEAARAYLAAVPADVAVGIVTFDNDVTTALEPTTDRASARAVIDDLELGPQTLLYDGLLTAIDVAGREGQRSLLVLSDGANTGDETTLEDLTATVAESNTLVDVVSLDRGGRQRQLEQIAAAGDGQVFTADGGNLASTFEAEAEVLANQVLVTAPLPEGFDATEGTIEVTLPAAGQDVVANAFVPIQEGSGDGQAAPLVAPPSATGWKTPEWLLPIGIGILAVGALVMAVMLVPAREQPLTIAERVSAYVGEQAPPRKRRRESDHLLDQARSAASGVLDRNAGLASSLERRLNAAGSNFKPAEWLTLHVGIVLAAVLLGLLVGGGSIPVSLLFLLLGIVVPPLYLRFKAGRRGQAFNNALPDTLQLMAGALSAGLSLAQSVDTVVREGPEPIAGEFKRVLVEHRVGISLEDAFEGVATRFDSRDFAWVVMAIRIQRQVGGNLGEILTTVANTMRERQYLRRQVKTLAAEGKMSAILLCALPPGFALFLSIANPTYMQPMFEQTIGLVMLGGAVLWLAIGVFWMSRMVKVEA